MTAIEAKNVGGTLIGLLTQQRLLYRQLHELARKQTELVDGGNPEMLLRVLAGRQRIIDRLSAVDKELRPIRQQWQEIAANLPEDQRAEAQELIGEVQAILGEILARDERDTAALSSQHQQVAQEIRGAVQGKRVNQAYGPGPRTGGQGQYLDLSE